MIPDEQDIRDVAMSAMTEGISQLGQDLAERVAAIGPTDSASAIDSMERTANSDETQPDVAEQDELDAQPLVQPVPRRVLTGASAAGAMSSSQYMSSRLQAGSVTASSVRQSVTGGDASVSGQFRRRGAPSMSKSQPSSVHVGTVPLPPARRPGVLHSSQAS